MGNESNEENVMNERGVWLIKHCIFML